MILRFTLIILFAACLSGCYGSMFDMHYVPPDTHTGYYKTFYAVKSNELVINNRVDLTKNHRLLVIGIKSPILGNINLFTENGMTIDENFWTQSVKSLGYFDNVITTSQINQFLSQDGHPGNNLNIIDPSDLKHVYDLYGNFLFLEITNYGDECILKIIDPQTNNILFMIKRNQFIYLTLSQQLYYPMLNSLKDWLKENN